jgi:sugar phosphate isomerase/epimerase
VTFTCSTACFRRVSIDVALEEIRRAGFNAIDLNLIPGFCDHFDAARQLAVERQDFVTLVRDSGLRAPTVTAALGNFNSSAGAGGFIFQSALAHLKLAAQLASDGLNVTCGKPAVQGGEFTTRALVQAKGLKEIAREAAQLGLNLNVRPPHSGDSSRSLEEALFLVEQIAEGNVFFFLDVSQWQAAGVRPEEAVRMLAGRIGHVRLPDSIGAGLHAFLEELERVRYDGSCALEVDAGEEIAGAGRRLRELLDHLASRRPGLCPANTPV